MRQPVRFVLIVASLCFLGGCDKATESTVPPKPETATTAPQLTRAQESMLEQAAAGNTAAVKDLLDGGVDVNMRGKDNNTPIMEAAYAGHVETVKLLLDRGADLSAKKNDGETVSSLAGRHQTLVELFNNVNAIVAAAGEGDNAEINELIARGTPVNALDTSGRTTLTEAAWNGHVETIKLLLEKGANPAIKKSDGETAVNLARSRKHAKVVELLEAKP